MGLIVLLSGMLLSGMLLSGMLLTGCGKQEADRGDNADPGSVEPVAGGTAVIAIASEPDALNPLVYSTAVAGIVFAEIHDGLTEMDDDLNYVPRIAKRWEVDSDGLGITYFLNRWLWSDGQPLTAYDVVRSLELFLDPLVASPKRGRLSEAEELMRKTTRSSAAT